MLEIYRWSTHMSQYEGERSPSWVTNYLLPHCLVIISGVSCGFSWFVCWFWCWCWWWWCWWWWHTWWWERCARTRLSRSCRPVPATLPGLLWSNSKCSQPPICEGSRETKPREGWRGSSFRCCCNETENSRDNFTTLQLYRHDLQTLPSPLPPPLSP